MDDILTSARSILATTPTRWQELITNAPTDLLTRPPAPGEWSAIECLQHMLDTERLVFPARVQSLLDGRDFPAFDPDAYRTANPPPTDATEVIHTFSNLRHSSLALFNTITPADLDKTARHSELGIVTLSQLLHEWAAHDLMHTVQAERALMQPFIVGSGPWRIYFADHDVEQA